MSPSVDRFGSLLNHLFNAITKDIDLEPGQVYVTKGFIELTGKVRIGAYSDDHGTHFHVKYIPGDIDARFSWPDMKLESYKSKNQFTTRQLKNIQITCHSDYCKDFVKQELTRAGRL